MKEINIYMTLTTSEAETEDTMWDKFIDWVEANGWSCGGMIKDITTEGNGVAEDNKAM